MSLLHPNFDKAGKGVSKNENNKYVYTYFESFFRNFKKLMFANIIYFIASLPVMVIVGAIFIYMIYPQLSDTLQFLASRVNTNQIFDSLEGAYIFQLTFIFSFLFLLLFGSGPASAGYTYITKNAAIEKHTWTFKDFVKVSKDNFKQSIAVVIFDIVALVVFLNAQLIYSALYSKSESIIYLILMGIIFFVFILLSFVHGYLYQMIITFDNKLSVLYKNALILAIAKFPKNILMILVPVLVTYWLFSYLAPMGLVILSLFLWISITRYPMDFYAARTINELVKKEKREENEKGTDE